MWTHGRHVTVLGVLFTLFFARTDAVEVCGHDSATCSPVSGGALAATVIAWILPPIAAICFWSTRAFMDDFDLSCSCRDLAQKVRARRKPGPNVPRRSASGARRAQHIRAISQDLAEAKISRPVALEMVPARANSAHSLQLEPAPKPEEEAAPSLNSADEEGELPALQADQWRCALCASANHELMPSCETCGQPRPGGADNV